MKTLLLSVALAAGLGVAPAIAAAQPVNGIPVDGGAVKKPVRGLKPSVKVRGLTKGIPVDGAVNAHPATATLAKPGLVNGIPVDNGTLAGHRPVATSVKKPVLTKGIPVDPAVQH